MTTTLASTLKPGDRIVRAGTPVTVLAVVQSAQVVRRPVLILTVQSPSGRPLHVTYHPNSAVELDTSEGDST